jgi:hypothetical protein
MQTLIHPARSQGSPTRRSAGRLGALALGVALTLTLLACAETQLKSDKLLLAREAVLHATNMGANEFAPAEMQAARERLDYAQTALTAGDLGRAGSLSDEAMVNTRLAETRVQQVKAENAATELRQDRRALQIELQNNIK